MARRYQGRCGLKHQRRFARRSPGKELGQRMATGTRPELRASYDGSRFDPVPTPDALEFAAALQREFGGRRSELLAAREQRRARLREGSESLGFLGSTASIREGDWKVASIP